MVISWSEETFHGKGCYMFECYLDTLLMFCIFAIPILIIGGVPSVLIVWKATGRFMVPFMVMDIFMPFVLSALWMRMTEWFNPHQDLDGYSFITVIGVLWALLVIVRFGLTNDLNFDIILKQSRITAMRVCWNRQTGTFEGRVSTDVWVQVPLLAPYL